MKPLPTPDSMVRPELAASEALPDMISSSSGMIDPGALEAFRAYDAGLLAEVPNALETYINHQRFGLN